MFINETVLKQKETVTQTMLINEFGFTETLIKKYLPEPILKRNPIYHCASPMKLWKVSDVLELALDSDFNEAYVKAQKRKLSAKLGAKKGVETKIQKYMAHMEEYLKEIRVIVLPDDIVWERTISAKSAWDEKNIDSESVDIDTKERWMVNYIRHNLTVYDSVLYDMPSKVGKTEAYVKYKNAVLDAIAKAYPSLMVACANQKL